jgi:hypothetical protein
MMRMFTTEDDSTPVNILIEWAPRRENGATETDPDVAPSEYNLLFLAQRRMSLLPIKPEASERYIVKKYVEGRRKPIPEPVYGMAYGACLMSERVKKIFDLFNCPRVEYIPVTLYSVGRKSELRESGPQGIKADEPYWIMNCYNNHDIVNKQKSVTGWYRPTQAVVDASQGRFSADDPPKLSNPQRIVLTHVPTDAMFGIVGLPDRRFVSEAFFDALVRSGLITKEWMMPFKRYALNADEQGYGGFYKSEDPRARAPLLLNGRTLYWGDLTVPMDFTRPAF